MIVPILFVALCACRTRFACLAFDRVFCWISADFCTEFLPANASECAARDCTFCFLFSVGVVLFFTVVSVLILHRILDMLVGL